MPLFKLTKPVKKLMKKNQDENRATIREDARKPKNVSKPKAITTKKPTMRDVAGRTDRQTQRKASKPFGSNKSNPLKGRRTKRS